MHIPKRVFRRCNDLLFSLGMESGIPLLTVKFCREEVSSKLKGLFTNKRMTINLEGKDYQCVDTMLPLEEAFISRPTIPVQETLTPAVSTISLGLVKIGMKK